MGANVEVRSDDHVTPLLLAAMMGNRELVESALSRGANVNMTANYGRTPLMMAASNRHLEIARLLVNKGVDLDAKSETGMTALMEAARSGDLDVVRLLLDKGANPNVKDQNGLTALTQALKSDHGDVAKLLQARRNENERGRDLRKGARGSASSTGNKPRRTNVSQKGDDASSDGRLNSTGDLYALVVGVSKYKHPKIKQLTVSDKDARDVAEFLRSQDKLFRKINVTLLTNEKATKGEIEKCLQYRLREAGKDDTVVIFWSGHGSDDPRLPGEFFFITHDADPEYLTATCINMNQNRLLNRLDSKRVVLIADTCYAGNFTSMGAKSLRPALENFIRDFSESRGRVFLTSSRPDELSMEKPGLANSVFTHYLLRGLTGEADSDGDGIVSIKELYDYVYQKTKSETNNIQHPQWEARLEGSFPLALARPAR
jgi:hypothetical protein